MSGGHWDYLQFRLNDMADSIQKDLEKAGTKNEWGEIYSNSPHLIAGLESAKVLLESTFTLLKHLDWYLSGDDGEETLKGHLKVFINEHTNKIIESLQKLKRET